MLSQLTIKEITETQMINGGGEGHERTQRSTIR